MLLGFLGISGFKEGNEHKKSAQIHLGALELSFSD